MGCLCALCVIGGVFFPPLWILAIVFAILALVSSRSGQQVVVLGPGGHPVSMQPQAVKTSPLAWIALVGIVVLITAAYFSSGKRSVRSAQEAEADRINEANRKTVEERLNKERKAREEKGAGK